MQAMREIELKGHIIDSFLLPRIFDKVMDMEGEFEILQFEIGKMKTDTSYARLMIKGKDKKHLENIISELHRIGATSRTCALVLRILFPPGAVHSSKSRAVFRLFPYPESTL